MNREYYKRHRGRLIRRREIGDKIVDIIHDYTFAPHELVKLFKEDEGFREAVLSGNYLFFHGNLVLKSNSILTLTPESISLKHNHGALSYNLCKIIKVVRRMATAKHHVHGLLRVDANGNTIRTPVKAGAGDDSSIGDSSIHSGGSYDGHYHNLRDRGSSIEGTEVVATRFLGIREPLRAEKFTPDNIYENFKFMDEPHPSEFANKIVLHMSHKGITVEELAEVSGLSVKTIQRMRTADDSRPKLKSIVAVCLALNLAPFASMDLLYLAGYRLTQTIEEQIYSRLLEVYWECSMEQINELLDYLHVPSFRSAE